MSDTRTPPPPGDPVLDADGVPGPSTPPVPPPTTPSGPQIRAELRRSRDDRVVGGVCAGLARYLGIDPVVVRIAAVVLALASGVGVLAYLIAWVVIPDDDGVTAAQPVARTATAVFGVVLVAVGASLVLDQVIPSLDRFLWPTLLIGLGVGVLGVGIRRGGAS